MADSYLQRLIDYNNWANEGLVEFLGTLPPEALNLSTPGVYGTVSETLEHVLVGEGHYLRYLSRLPRVEYQRDGPLTRERLQAMARESAGNLAAVVERLPPPEEMLPLRDGMRAAGTVLIQLIAHGCEHRAQVATILGANGFELPDLAPWGFGIVAGVDDWPPDWGTEPDARPRFPAQ